jgi:hypothetical protein
MITVGAMIGKKKTPENQKSYASILLLDCMLQARMAAGRNLEALSYADGR